MKLTAPAPLLALVSQFKKLDDPFTLEGMILDLVNSRLKAAKFAPVSDLFIDPVQPVVEGKLKLYGFEGQQIIYVNPVTRMIEAA